MRKRPIQLGVEGVSAEIRYHEIDGHEVKTLIADFGEGCRTLSTACGYRKLRYGANPYAPLMFWEQNLDFDAYLDRVHRNLDMDRRNAAMLVTAVDMDNFAYLRSCHSDLTVGCLATAGVKSNALRMGVDKAQVSSSSLSAAPTGTINVIIFTNADFTDGAMTMAVVNVTEAKAGALQDSNVRTAYSPLNIATGTGTDGVIVASGHGPEIASTSGHVKIGELIGTTARKAIIRAIKNTEAES